MSTPERRASADFALVVQTIEVDRAIAIYTHEAPDHPEGQRTATVLTLDTGEITDAYGRKLSG